MRKKKLIVSIILIMLIILNCSCSNERETRGSASDMPRVVVGCDNYSPFSYADADGDMTGIDVELAREAFSRMGYEPEFVFIKWEDKKSLLEDKTIDCI